MKLPLDEKELYAPVSDYFITQGYFVVSGCRKNGIDGTSEFGLPIEGQDMRVDIAAARWHDVYQIETIAVEVKRIGTISRSLGAGIWQATDYQVAFDKVFIATEASGSAGNKRSVIESLGIGHICVDVGSKRCELVHNGDFRNGSRFDESVRASHVTPRLVMFLAFKDALGIPIRYGETFGGGGYIAKNMGGNIQYNSWYDRNTGKCYFGINIEHIDSFRKIIAKADWKEFRRHLSQLPKNFKLTLTKDPVPSWRNKKDLRLLGPISSPEVDITSLRKAITNVIEEYPRRWRPHLTISTHLWTYEKTLTQEICTKRIDMVKNELSELMSVVVASV